MFSRFHNRKGFTLIELMIVVVIIGILAALAIPRFFQATDKTGAKTEAKLTLNSIKTANGNYFDQNDCYTSDLSDLVEYGHKPPTNPKCEYTLYVGNDRQTYMALASYNGKIIYQVIPTTDSTSQ